MGGYDDPTGWITFNGLTSLAGASPSCAQGSPGAVGSYYATVTTQNTSFGVIQGIITVGDAASGATGFAYSSRPGALTGQWQYGIQSGDQGMVAVYLSKWNPGTQSADSVGAGVALLTGTVSGWSAFSVPIQYFNSNDPDTAYVVVASSMNDPVAGSFVKIDALGFGGSAGIAEASAKANIKVYPSPATRVLNVVATGSMKEVRVLDMTGRVVMEKAVAGQQIELDVADLNTGRYLLELRLADGSRAVRNFVKE
jgi:hypothetical protein